MLSSEGNENGEKTTIGLITAAHFFCTFLCRCFAGLQRENSRNFLVTPIMEEMSCVFLFAFILYCRLFSPSWPLAFLIFSF